MNNIYIPKTNQSLEINLNINGTIRLSGISTPDNVLEFFTPVIDWVKEYFKTNPDSLELIMEIDYLNTSSTRVLVDLLKIIKSLSDNQFVPEISWKYEEDDEDILELGEELALISDLKFTYIVV